MSDTFNGADLRNVCTEAGLFAIRVEREYIIQVNKKKLVQLKLAINCVKPDFSFFNLQEDLMKAVRKVADNKKLESKLDYKPV